MKIKDIKKALEDQRKKFDEKLLRLAYLRGKLRGTLETIRRRNRSIF